jgi:hypothetical protein
MALASRLLRIQHGEGRIAGLVVCLAFVAMTAFTFGESAIDALFLDRVGAQALPLTYILQGAATPRVTVGMAYDAAHGEVVLFGGAGEGVLNDTWIWDGTTWTEQHPSTVPPAHAAWAWPTTPCEARS